METARPKVFGPDHQRFFHRPGYGLPGALGELETEQSLCLALDNGNAFLDLAGGIHTGHLENNKITASQLAVDCEVEERNVAVVLCDRETNADGPNMLWHEWAFLPYDAPLVPSGTKRATGRFVGNRQDGSSDPPRPATTPTRRW